MCNVFTKCVYAVTDVSIWGGLQEKMKPTEFFFFFTALNDAYA